MVNILLSPHKASGVSQEITPHIRRMKYWSQNLPWGQGRGDFLLIHLKTGFLPTWGVEMTYFC